MLGSQQKIDLNFLFMAPAKEGVGLCDRLVAAPRNTDVRTQKAP